MAIIEEDSLKAEEKYGNFEPSSEESQGSFLLNELESYPGELPYIEPVTKKIIPEESDEIIPEPKPFPPEEPEPVEEAGETWDLFEDESSIPTQADVIKEAEELESQDTIKFNELLKAEEEENLPPPTSFEEEDEDPESSTRVSYELEKKEPKIQEDFVPQITGDAVVELDDDFRTMLEADINGAKSRKPRKKKEVEPTFDDVKNQDGLAAFRSVDDLGESVVIDISSIEAVHPSTFLVLEENVDLMNSNIPKAVLSEQISMEKQSAQLNTEADLKKQIKQEKKEKKAKKEKKERKPFPIIPILIYTGAILIPLLLAAATYYYFNSMKFPKLHNTIFKITKVHEVIPPKIIKKDTLAEKKEIKKDTISEIKNPEPDKVVEKPKPKTIVLDNLPKREQKKKIEKPIKEVKQEPVKKESKTIKKQIDKKVPVKPLQEPKNEIYQIELYSTPSIEDAEIWMNKLKKRSINPVLQLQKVRGITVYKIRYGYFKSRQEAQESAIKLGFPRSWIDRIK